MSITTTSSSSRSSVDAWRTEKYKFRKEDLAKVNEAIGKGRYLYSIHALERMKTRNLTAEMIEAVLKKGRHESTKDAWHNIKRSWNFQFRGHVKQRVIVVHVGVQGIPPSVIIITAIDKEKYKDKQREFTCFPSVGSYKCKELKAFQLAELDTSFDELLRNKTQKCKSDSLPNKHENIDHPLLAEGSKKRKFSDLNLKTSDGSVVKLLGKKPDTPQSISLTC